MNHTVKPGQIIAAEGFRHLPLTPCDISDEDLEGYGSDYVPVLFGPKTTLRVGAEDIGFTIDDPEYGVGAYTAGGDLLDIVVDKDAAKTLFDQWLKKRQTNGGKGPDLESGPARDAPAEGPDCSRIELVLFTSSKPLTKRIFIAPDGTLADDKSACVMWAGRAMRMELTSLDELAGLIGSLTSKQAIAPGSLRAGLPDQVEVTTKEKLNGRNVPGIISRSRAYLTFEQGRRGFCLGDFDRKGITAEVRGKLEQSGGFVGALETVMPELKTAGYVMRASTSAGLFRTDTGQRFTNSGGVHLYLGIKDVSDTKRFLETLHDRCWLMGLGWYWIGAAGTPFERSIIDCAVATPEHLCFEGPPLLGPGLAQDGEQRIPKVVDGDWLDTQAACPPLSIVEQSRCDQLKAKERARLAPEIKKARAAYIERQAGKLVARTGMSKRAAEQVIERQCEGVLRPDVELPFDDPELRGVTVADVLANPQVYEGETLADPLEGIDYGRCKAKIMRQDDGTPWIHSFAHGRTIYKLKHDAASVRKAMQAAAKEDVVATFTRLAAGADLDAVELDELRRLAKEISGVGLRVIDSMLKAVQRTHDERRASEARQHDEAKRDDPRPRIKAPFPDAPFQPQMKVLNGVIGKVPAAVPPLRNIDGDATRLRKLPVPDMHAFTPGCVNVEPEEMTTRLPPPEQWLLSKMSEMEVAEMIEEHIDYYVESQYGARSVHLLTPFVNHFMRRDDEALPTVVAIATVPIVLADGNLLAPDGLDRLRGIVFNIPKELRAVIPPAADCTEDAIGAAMTYLCDEWLVDVATDLTGKCIIIADALTLIERSLLPDRPCFFYTAGRRGGGKTTTLTMLIMAVTGVRPAAAAWSTNEEERRKALMAYFLFGVPYIIWDNIPRGMQISCPHIEKSCTATYYSDRKLGYSELVCTAASTIHHFTGNNIGAKGDLASRKLEIRITVNRADPENREFKHPDPVGWTEAHRAKIMTALFTLLLGNPQLKAAHDAPGKTRFKMWWRLVGSAVEHAAGLAGHEIDFKKLFLAQEEYDEESASLADVLGVLATAYPKEFRPEDAAALVNSCWSGSDEEKSNKKMVREFLHPGAANDHVFSGKSIGRLLKKHLDNVVVADDGGTLVLRKREGYAKAPFYRVDRRSPEGLPGRRGRTAN